MSSIKTVKKNIAELEKQWKVDLKKEHGGGLDSGLNQKLVALRIALRLLEKPKRIKVQKTKVKSKSKR